MIVKVTPPKQATPLLFKWGGSAKVISDNPYSDSPTIEFTGKSHAKGGVGIQYGTNTAEVEGKETAYVGKDGDMNIMGNMTVPGTNMKFKNAMKKISVKENKANKQSSTGSEILDRYAFDTSKFGDIGTTSGKLMELGAKMKLKELDNQKTYLSSLQNAMLETADEFGIDPQAMSNGKIKKAKNGMKMKKAQHGALLSYNPSSISDTDLISPIINSVTSNYVAPYYFNDIVPQQYQPIIREAANKYGLSPEILTRVIGTESSFDPTQQSSKGNKGLMQLSPEIAKKYGVSGILTSSNPKDIAKVIDAGAHYLSDLKHQNSEDIGLALAAYNGGQKAINSVREALGKKSITHSDLLNYWRNRRKTNPSDTPSAWQNETYNYVNKILNEPSDEFYNTGYKNFYNTYYNPPPTEPKLDINLPSKKEMYTPNVPDQNVPLSPQRNPTTPTPTWTTITPKEYKPTPLPISQIAPELYAFANNAEQGVQGQSYTPRLLQPYSISLQDQLDQNQSDFRGLEQLAPNNPEYLSTLAAKKYQANQSVLGNEFRTNQQISNAVDNANNQILNKAELTNLQLGDQQYVRQAQAKSNTKAENNAILTSIASKLAQNDLTNKEMAAYSQMFPYYQQNNQTGQLEYIGPKTAPVSWPTSTGIDPTTKTKKNKASNGSIVKLYKTK